MPHGAQAAVFPRYWDLAGKLLDGRRIVNGNGVTAVCELATRKSKESEVWARQPEHGDLDNSKALEKACRLVVQMNTLVMGIG